MRMSRLAMAAGALGLVAVGFVARGLWQQPKSPPRPDPMRGRRDHPGRG